MEKPKPVDVVAPLDAYATAKPNEPTFTLQGGDPLAAPLVLVWAQAARIQAMPEASLDVFDALAQKVAQAAIEHHAENEHERDELLKRASLAEDVSWDMDAYRRNEAVGASEAETSGEKFSVDERLDLFDIRTRAASEVSNMIAVVHEMSGVLREKGFLDEDAHNMLRSIFVALRGLYNRLQPKKERHLDLSLNPPR